MYSVLAIRFRAVSVSVSVSVPVSALTLDLEEVKGCGVCVYAPPLVGRKREDGRPATAGAAAYPSKMNELFAKAIHDGLGRSKSSAPANFSNP